MTNIKFRLSFCYGFLYFNFISFNDIFCRSCEILMFKSENNFFSIIEMF